jgi:hypothetical protein
MAVKQTDSAAQRPTSTSGVEVAAVIADIASRRIMSTRPSDPPLRCVSSGYLSDGSSCHARIPRGVVTDAWAREKRSGVFGDRFFHFTSQGEVWLGYGLKSGEVRGVYCPVHSLEREQRSSTDGAGEDRARAKIALTG